MGKGKNEERLYVWRQFPNQLFLALRLQDGGIATLCFGKWCNIYTWNNKPRHLLGQKEHREERWLCLSQPPQASWPLTAPSYHVLNGGSQAICFFMSLDDQSILALKIVCRTKAGVLTESHATIDTTSPVWRQEEHPWCEQQKWHSNRGWCGGWLLLDSFTDGGRVGGSWAAGWEGKDIHCIIRALGW